MTARAARLIMVYNADTGILSALMHALHKTISPSTYPCSLCALTYGAVSMRPDWKRFWRRLDVQVVFHHRDDFAEAYPECEAALPTILLAEPGRTPRVLIGKQELDAMVDLSQLIERVETVLADEREEAPNLWATA